MAEEVANPPPTRPSSRRKPYGKRELATAPIAARLPIADKQLFEQIAAKRRMSESELFRDILHRWCVVERRAPGSQEETQDDVLINLQKETLETLKALGDRMDLLVRVTTGYGESLNVNEAQLSRLMNISNGHHNVSVQTFAALWSLLELVQRFYVERLVAGNIKPCLDQDVHSQVVGTTDSIRAEGLRMMTRLIKTCGSSQQLHLDLISPQQES